jgi:hypothetical protein
LPAHVVYRPKDLAALGTTKLGVVAWGERQVRNTQPFCRRAADAQFFQPGSSVHYNRPLPPSSQ